MISAQHNQMTEVEDGEAQVKISTQQEEQKAKRMHSRILCNILIPLMLSILISTGLAVLILTILAPYWSEQGGNSLSEQQTTVLNAMNTVQGNTITLINQKFSHARSQILVTMWDNYQNFQADISLQARTTYLYQNRAISFAAQSDSSLWSQIPGFNATTNESTKCVGWGKVSLGNKLDNAVNSVRLLTSAQQSDLKLIISILPILQIIYTVSSDEINRIYFHTLSGVYVSYPFSITPKYQSSPLNQSYHSYKINQYNIITSFISDTISGELTICDAIVSYSGTFQGILCMSTQLQDTQKIIYNMGQYRSLNNGNMCVSLADENYTSFASSASMNGFNYSGLPSYFLPFVDYNQDLFAQFVLSIDFMLNETQDDITFLYTNSYRFLNNTLQISMKKLQVRETGLDNQTLVGTDYQTMTLVTWVLQDEINQEFSTLSDDIQSHTLLMILVQTGPIVAIMCGMAWIIAYVIIRKISEPIADLQYKLRLLCQDTLYISIYSNYKPSAQDINLLYEAFHRLITVFNFANPRYFEGNDAELIIKYSQGLYLFEKIKSNRGVGLNLTNIGHIHRKNQRYQEAIDHYKDALFLCEEDLLKITNTTRLAKLYPILAQNKYISQMIQKTSVIQRSESIRYQRNDVINGPLRRKTTLARVTEPAKFIISKNEMEEQKAILEEIYSDRNFSLINTLIEFAKVASDIERDHIYQEAIERLRFVIYLDEKAKRNLARQIISKTLLAQCHLELSESDQAYHEIEAAEALLEDYENESENGKNTIDPAILRQRTLMQKGFLLMRHNNLKYAALIFTDCIENGKYYDPATRLQCLQQLEKIFVEQKLIDKASNIPKLLQQSQNKPNKDIVFILDNSESMENEKKEYSIRGILKIFDMYLQDQDRVAFMRFNQTLNVVFDLTEKSDNAKFLRNAIENSLKLPASGQSALLQAILHGQKLLIKASPKMHQRWIVVVTDGEDNISQMSVTKMRQQLQSQPDISLIIIGIALPIEAVDELNELCRMTKEGLFIHSVMSEDLDIAFQALTNLMNRNYFIDNNVELLTH